MNTLNNMFLIEKDDINMEHDHAMDMEVFIKNGKIYQIYESEKRCLNSGAGHERVVNDDLTNSKVFHFKGIAFKFNGEDYTAIEYKNYIILCVWRAEPLNIELLKKSFKVKHHTNFTFLAEMIKYMYDQDLL